MLIVVIITTKNLSEYQRNQRNIREREKKFRKERTIKQLESLSNADLLNIQCVSVYEDTSNVYVITEESSQVEVFMTEQTVSEEILNMHTSVTEETPPKETLNVDVSNIKIHPTGRQYPYMKYIQTLSLMANHYFY